MDMSSKQLLVLDFIKQFIASKGYSPTVREIAQGLYLKSPSTVQGHLQKLVSAGFITIDKRKSRTIELLVQNEYLTISNKIANIPVLDTELESVSTEYLEIPIYMLNNYDPKNLYAFKSDKSIYIANVSLTKKDRPSLVIVDNTYFYEEAPKEGNIFANIIGEFKIY